MMKKQKTRKYSHLCNTELMGIWRSNQGSVIYELFFVAENKGLNGAKQDTGTEKQRHKTKWKLFEYVSICLLSCFVWWRVSGERMIEWL
jgi:hypothetical protein